MPAEPVVTDWPWSEVPGAAKVEGLGDAFRACFTTPSGRIVLNELRRLFLNRRVPPSSSDAELRHVEGQRSLAAWILAMAESPGGASAAAATTASSWISR